MKNSECTMSPDLMDRVAEKIEAEMGWSFPEVKRRDLKNALHRMRRAMGFEHDEACAAWLLSGRWDKEKAELCALHLTIGETYFFREPRAFELMCDYARKKAAGSDGAPLRIWSAACCTGEEPYSIAMTLRQAVPELDPGRISILATDINSHHLQLARAGVYRQWSFRQTGTAMQRLNFEEAGGNQLRVKDDIKEMVRFAELNLAAPVYPSVATDTQAMDIIFCRNVLMYFSRPQAKKVIDRLRQCLVTGGWLIVSPSEASAEMFSGFSGVYYPDAIYFRKSEPSEQPKPVPAAVAPATEWSGDWAGQAVVKPKTGFPKKAAPTKQDASARSRPAASPAEAVSRARKLANEGDIAAALRCLEQALHSGPPTAELYHAKAMIAMESGHDRDAMQSLKKALYLQPDFILGHYLMGILQSAQNKRSEARRQFQAAGELLAALDDDEIVPGSDGLHAAYLLASVHSYMQRGEA